MADPLDPWVQVFVLVGLAFSATTYWRWKPLENDWRNIPFVIVWLLLMAWCIVPRDPSVDAEGHKGARKSLAFRLGKKLNCVLRQRRRNAATRD